MKAVGIIAEYNPFHNGHLYHLNKVKEMFPDDVIVVVLGGNFTQRGETSIINKWDKAEIVLKHGADIVIELPYPFATQSADFFAKGSIQILKEMKISKIVFGSESNDSNQLTTTAKLQLNSKEYQSLIKKYLDQGINYKTAQSKALKTLTNISIDTPNDILGISYIKEIIKQNADIEPITIKRTNDYHDNNINEDITSATSIREAIKNNVEIKNTVPKETYEKLNNNNIFSIDDYFHILKYQILTNIDSLDKFQTVDEGIENRIKKYITSSKSLNELISKIKTKRYTYNKIRRMLTHIMCNFTKEEANIFKDITYLRILGFSEKGKTYLNSIKKQINLPFVTNFNKNNDKMLDLEFRTTCVYASILDESEKTKLIEMEYKNSPIRINKNGF
ncbi:MAG TPA: nucleotidyltransferase [Mollicutes bacterium]|nr:nucleotidyltransferase [Mollicutes bacterium]